MTHIPMLVLVVIAIILTGLVCLSTQGNMKPAILVLMLQIAATRNVRVS